MSISHSLFLMVAWNLCTTTTRQVQLGWGVLLDTWLGRVRGSNQHPSSCPTTNLTSSATAAPSKLSSAPRPRTRALNTRSRARIWPRTKKHWFNNKLICSMFLERKMKNCLSGVSKKIVLNSSNTRGWFVWKPHRPTYNYFDILVKMYVCY